MRRALAAVVALLALVGCAPAMQGVHMGHSNCQIMASRWALPVYPVECWGR